MLLASCARSNSSAPVAPDSSPPPRSLRSARAARVNAAGARPWRECTDEELRKIVIGYEPVGASGKGKTAAPPAPAPRAPPPAPAPAPAPRMGREAAALAALSDAELRTAATRPRVIECALLELLATPAPDGAAAWTLSGANAILGVSQRTLLEHHAQHGDKWPSLGTLARCHLSLIHI